MKPVRCDNASSWEVDDTFDNAQWKKCQTNITNEMKQLYALCQSSAHMVSLGMSLQATTGCFFFTVSALKVLSVGNGKIPTKKVKISVCHRETVKI